MAPPTPDLSLFSRSLMYNPNFRPTKRVTAPPTANKPTVETTFHQLLKKTQVGSNLQSPDPAVVLLRPPKVSHSPQNQRPVRSIPDMETRVHRTCVAVEQGRMRANIFGLREYLFMRRCNGNIIIYRGLSSTEHVRCVKMPTDDTRGTFLPTTRWLSCGQSMSRMLW